jgi:DNA polymerase-4
LDVSPVLRLGESVVLHSVGNGITFKRDLVSPEDVQTAVTVLADKVAGRMRHHAVKCMTIQVTIKDASFKVITRQKPIPPTFLAADLAKASLELIQAAWKIGLPIRMLTITAQKLVPAGEAVEQPSLFQPEPPPAHRKHQEELAAALDGIRAKYGPGSIAPGCVLQNDLGIGEDYGQDE